MWRGADYARKGLVSAGALEMFIHVATGSSDAELRGFCAAGVENLCKEGKAIALPFISC